MRSRSSLISRLMLRMPRPSSFPPPDTSARPRTTSPASVAMGAGKEDRKSTRLNSSHVEISYAVFCLKKKKDDETYGGTFVVAELLLLALAIWRYRSRHRTVNRRDAAWVAALFGAHGCTYRRHRCYMQ